MEFRHYIEIATREAGSVEQLAKQLNQMSAAIRSARQHKRGLPVYACIKLAHMIHVDPMTVIAASELVTEKHEERKAVFLPFVEMGRLAHPMIAPFAMTLTALTLAMENSVSTIRAFLL